VLKDYKSDKLNLEDPEIFRDFTKPMGVQNPDNEIEGEFKIILFAIFPI